RHIKNVRLLSGIFYIVKGFEPVLRSSGFDHKTLSQELAPRKRRDE
ncbi:MAG: hypothetical protein QG658_70, partial [Patescibacteria group bacterium]|nr:hypothetical protein [Patescibacteria group bacterium]